MIVTLTDAEVREILREAIHKRLEHQFDSPTKENTHFEINTGQDVEIENGEKFSFVWKVTET